MLTNQSIDPNARPDQRPFILWRPFVRAWQWLVPPTQAHRDRQSRGARIAAISAVIGIAIAVIVTAFFYARPLKDAYDDWSADKLVRNARKLLSEGQAAAAFKDAQEAYQIAPDHVDAIRLNAQMFVGARLEQSLFFIGKLEQAGAATDEDMELKVRAYLSLNRNKEASELLEDLIHRHGTSPSLSQLAVTVWGSDAVDTRLLPALKAYCQKNPEDREGQLRLAIAQTESGLPGEVVIGRQSLWSIAAGDDDPALKAIEYLNRTETLPPDETRRIAGLLASHPKRQGIHIVQSLRRRVQLEPRRKAVIIAEGAQLFEGKKDAELAPFVRWLVEEHEYSQVVSLLTAEQAKSYMPILENYFTALTMLGRFKELESTLKDPSVQARLSRAKRAFYDLHLAFVTGKPAEQVRKLMRQAISAAMDEGAGDILLGIGEYGAKRQQMDISEEAYRAAVAVARRASRQTSSQGRLLQPGIEGLVRACRHNGDTEGFIKAASDALELMPENQDYQEQLIYASLLTGREIESSLNRTLALLEARQDDPSRNLSAALGYYRLSDIGKAVQHVQKSDLRKLDAGQQAVLAGIIRGAGYRKDAQAIVRAIPPDAKMLPEERLFYDRANR